VRSLIAKHRARASAKKAAADRLKAEQLEEAHGAGITPTGSLVVRDAKGATTIDGRSIGWADPKYQPRFRITYKPKDPSEEPRVLYSAQEKQDQLHSCDKPNIWFGGAAGGGKSHAARWHAYINCMRRKGLKVLLLRRHFTELEKTHILEVPKEMPADVATYNATAKRLTFRATGSILVFGHAKDLKAVRSYLSTAWDLIIVDEASEFLPQQLSLLQSRLRTKLEGVRPQFLLVSNPGGEAHLWLVSRFITKKVDPKEDGRYKPAEYQFIQSLVGDNNHNDDFYLDRLMSMSESDREAFLFGNMNAFAGQYFREWKESIHVDRAPTREDLLDWFEVEAGMDWGYDPHPGVVLFGAFDPFGRVTLYKELKFELSSPREVAEQIVQRCETEAERRMTIRGDSAMWIRQVGTGVSIADEINEVFAELGTSIVLVQANKDRLNGWMRLHQYLDPRRPDPTGLGALGPYLTVQRYDETTGYGCPYLISTIGAQMHDDKQSGDMKKMGNDHAVDALRYLVMGRAPLSILPRDLQPRLSVDKRVHAKRNHLLELARRKKEEARAALSGNAIEGEGSDEISDAFMPAEEQFDDESLELENAGDIWG
jgi:phage terminase large subunit